MFVRSVRPPVLAFQAGILDSSQMRTDGRCVSHRSLKTGLAGALLEHSEEKSSGIADELLGGSDLIFNHV